MRLIKRCTNIIPGDGTLRRRALISLLFFLFTGRSQAATLMHLDTVSTGPNQTAVFSLYVSNDHPMVGFQVDITFPSVLTYKASSAVLTSRATNHALSASVISPGVLRIIAYSIDLSAFEGSSGAVATISFTTGTSPGTYPLALSNAIVADSLQHNILTGSTGGLYNLGAPLLHVDPQSIDFGSVPLYQGVSRPITLTNNGNTDLHVTGLSIDNPVFRADDSSGVTISPGESVTRYIEFGSSKKGTFGGSLRVSRDDSAGAALSLSANAFAVNELRIGSASGRSGYVFHLPISINNMEPFIGFQFKLALPSVAKFVKGSATLSARSSDQVVAADTSGGILTCLAYSPSNSAFRDSNGVVVTLDLLVLGQGGSYTLSPSNVIISDSAAANIESAGYSGSLEVISPRLSLSCPSIDYGKVSVNDTASASLRISNEGSDTLFVGSFSIDDSSFSASFSAPATLPPGESRNVEVSFHSLKEGNHSGSITIRSNDSQHDPARVSLSADVFLNNELSLVPGNGFARQRSTVVLRLDNLEPVSGFQFDLSLPSAMSPMLDSVRLTSRCVDHMIAASLLPSGAIRVISYSPTLAVYSLDSGAILELPVVLGDTTGVFPLHLVNAILSDTAGKNVLTGTNDGTFEIRDDIPLAVVVTNFIAKSDISSITLSWMSQYDANTAGFSMLRRDTEKAAFEIVSSYLTNEGLKIMASSEGAGSYNFKDRKVLSGMWYEYELVGVSRDGITKPLGRIRARLDIPHMFALHQNYPDPFNPTTTIDYELPGDSRVTLKVFDVLGRIVATPVDQREDAGSHSVRFDGSRLPSGVYFYTLRTDKFSQTKKMLLQK